MPPPPKSHGILAFLGLSDFLDVLLCSQFSTKTKTEGQSVGEGQSDRESKGGRAVEGAVRFMAV